MIKVNDFITNGNTERFIIKFSNNHYLFKGNREPSKLLEDYEISTVTNVNVNKNTLVISVHK